MNAIFRRFTLTVLLVLVSVAGIQAANVVIIESQSWNATHVMDNNWAAVVTSMGHAASIQPQTTLDTPAFIAGTDLLIISSGEIPLSVTRQNIIRQAYSMGMPVYLQTEANPLFDTNQTWVSLVNDDGGNFAWNGSVSGTLTPMRVTGTVSNTPNPVNQVIGFQDGAYGTGSQEVETLFHYGDQEYGWYSHPVFTGAINLSATTSDQEWIRTLTDPTLMENFVDNLLNRNASELQVRLWIPGPPIIVPAAGGTYTFNGHAYNNSANPFIFDVWSMIQLPNGNLIGPQWNLTGVTLPAFTTSPTQSINQNIPGFAPAGTYFQLVTVGGYPGLRTNLDTIRFVKL
ncbi:hypothetical protein KQI52_03905 [bacterium]|nr:hypothetical protein [bacterium]